jgi:hypothetical protein
MPPFRVNLGGEGEVPGVLNQQGRWAVLDPGYGSSRGGLTFAQLVARGDDYLIADNTRLPLPDGCCDEVLTDSVPIDMVTHKGPGVQTSEVHRIVKSGGVWTHDNQLRYTKP